MTTYVFDQASTMEQRRLDALAALYDEGTIGHLVNLGVVPGWRCWEVGAGTGTVARWLAHRVGADGSVLATDIDDRFLEPLSDRPNLEVRRHDVVDDPPPDDSFDLIHARALLEHLPDRVEVLRTLTDRLAPGGWLLVEDVVMMPPASAPLAPVVARIVDAFTRGFHLAGADPHYGLQLPADLSAVGLRDVGRHARVPVVSSATPEADFHVLSLEHLRDLFVAADLLTHDEIDEALSMMRKPGVSILAPIMIAAWGQRAA